MVNAQDWSFIWMSTQSCSILLYILGRCGGEMFTKWYYHKFPRQQALIEGKIEYLRKKGSLGVFVSKLIPMVRTLISIPAGMIRMSFGSYVFSSIAGIAIWNLIFVGAGYLFGDAVFTMFKYEGSNHTKNAFK